MNKLLPLIALGALLLIPTTNFAFAQVTDFYWSENVGQPGHEVFTADAGTLTISQITSGGFDRIRDVELDPTANKLWWNNWANIGVGSATEGIYNSNLGGTGQLQITGGTESNTSTGFASGHHKMVLDPANQKVFFTRGVSYANPGGLGDGGEVSSVNMDGTGYTQLNTNADNWFPSGIERIGSTLYFGDPGVFIPPFSGAVNSMMTDGSAPVANLVPHTNGEGRSHALDNSKGLLFYSAFDTNSIGMFGGAIFVYDVVNGGPAVQILSDPNTGYPDIELDTANMILYWTDNVNGRIDSASYDAAGNLGAITTEISNLQNPFGLALAFAPQVVGGEFLPIDSTALLLAGLQTSAIWMLPVLAGAAGVGAYYIKTRMNKE